jgi:hypothetical protein
VSHDTSEHSDSGAVKGDAEAATTRPAEELLAADELPMRRGRRRGSVEARAVRRRQRVREGGVAQGPDRAQDHADPDRGAPNDGLTGRCRLIALGDIHGDLDYMRKALEAAGLVNGNGGWVGGCATLVQLGDVVDRGPNSIGCLKYLERLKQQAAEDGGRVVTLLGNHELINVAGDNAVYAHPLELERLGGQEGWLHHFSPHGPFWRRFQSSPTAVNMSGVVFVHGGISPHFARLGLEHINQLVWKNMQRKSFEAGILGEHGPLWNREVIQSAARGDCRLVHDALTLLHAARMVVGHTAQADGKIHEFCDGKMVAIDTGLSRAMFGHPSVLEVLADGGLRPIYPSEAALGLPPPVPADEPAE